MSFLYLSLSLWVIIYFYLFIVILVGREDKCLWSIRHDLLQLYSLPRSKEFFQDALASFILFNWKIICCFLPCSFWGRFHTHGGPLRQNQKEKLGILYTTLTQLFSEAWLWDFGKIKSFKHFPSKRFYMSVLSCVPFHLQLLILPEYHLIWEYPS